ncbi:MAG TPA: PilN domain-containing protein [Chitinivibrionales bacterium]|nr:PilN domain-containing protein [Chitinivibrionales bacterium]
MFHLHGIIATDEGSFLMASLEKTPQGWVAKRLRRWNAGNALGALLLLHRGVVGAAPSHWRPDVPSSVSASSLVTSQTGGPLAPQAGEAIITNYTSRLSHNLLAVVPADAFLCTLPLALVPDIERSFISVYQEASFYKIGIIVDGGLAGVFAMAPAAPQALAAHLARIERYWARIAAAAPFPNRVYLLGSCEAPAEFPATRLDCSGLGIDLSDPDALAAAGAALSGRFGSVPRFSADTAPASLRKLRTALYAVSAGMVLCCLLACAALPMLAAATHGRLASYKKQYQAILANNPDLKVLMGKNDSLARLLISAHDETLNRTRWSQMLQTLGALRPDGMFLEMLGSEGSPASGTVRVALSGWVHSESQVTGFIASLQQSGLYPSVTLSSLERNESSNLLNFRITCNLNVSAGFPAK